MTGAPPPSPRQRPAPPRYERALAALVIAGLLALGSVFLSPALRGRIPVWGDLGRGTLPMRAFYHHCLEQGHAFDWMPDLFGGYFVSGAGGQGMYHPLNLLLYRLLPLDLAFALEVSWPVALLAVGMVVFLRRYVSLVGACMGSLVATFSLLFVLYLHTPPMTSALAHIPWFLTALDLAIEARTRARRWLACAAIALVNGSQVLQGFPQALWYSLLSGAIFALCMLIMRRAPWQSWLAIAGGVLLGMGIGAAELLSMYSMFVTSTRVGTDPVLLAYPPIEPWSLLDLLVPSRSTYTWSLTYVGAAPLLIVLWWLTARPKRLAAAAAGPGRGGSLASGGGGEREERVRQLTCFAFLLALLTVLLAMGLRAKLYYLQLWLPVVGSFRAPFRIFIVTQFSVGILSGVAFDRLMAIAAARRSTPWRHLALPWAGVAAAIALAAWFASQPDARVVGRWEFAAGALLIGGSAVALTLAARGRRLGLPLLVLLTVGDLAYYSVGSLNGSRLWRNLPTYEEYVAQCAGPPGPPGGRLLYEDSRDSWGSAVNDFYLSGHRTINGYSGLYPERRLDYAHVNTLRAAQVAWVWQPENSGLPTALGPPQADGVWMPVPNPLPRVRLVSKAQIAVAWADDLKRIDVDDTALVLKPMTLTPSPPGEATLEEDVPGRITVKTKSPGRQLLVVSESYQEGWQVRIDGRPADLVQVNGDFLGCVVDAGEHRAEFEFSPRAVRYGRWITLASLALALGMVAIARFDRLPGRGVAAAAPVLSRGRAGAASDSRLEGWSRVVILAVASLACLLCGETLLAYLRPSIVPYRLLPKTGRPYLAAYSSYLPFTLPAGARFPHATEDFSVVYEINALGYRGPNPRTIEKPPGTKRLLLLGDSFTLGWGNELATSFAGRLEDALHPRGWEVINAGYKAGYSPDCYYAFLATEGYALAPDAVAVVVFTANDVSDMMDSQWAARDEEGGPTSVRTLRYFTDTEGRIIRLLHGDVPLRYRFPVLRECRLFVGFLDLLVPDPPTVSEAEAMDRLEQVLDRMDAALTRRNVPLLIFLLPDRLNGAAVDWGRTAMHEAIRTRLLARGLPAHDLSSVLTDAAYFPHDGHLNPEGNRRVYLEVLRALDGHVDLGDPR